MSKRISLNGDGKARPTNNPGSRDSENRPANPVDEREQHIIKALTGRYNEIEALWNAAEEDLKRFRIPHAVELPYDSDHGGGPSSYYFLCFMRYGKGWRIVHKSTYAVSEYDPSQDDEVDYKPIVECPLDLRLSMIDHFEALRKKVIEEAEKCVPTLDDAVSRFRKVLKG